MRHELDIAALIEEIRRYLAAIDAFRAAGCEPTWRAKGHRLAARPTEGGPDVGRFSDA